jgi:hypothetical protein
MYQCDQPDAAAGPFCVQRSRALVTATAQTWLPGGPARCLDLDAAWRAPGARYSPSGSRGGPAGKTSGQRSFRPRDNQGLTGLAAGGFRVQAGQAAASNRSHGWEPSVRPIQTGRLLHRYSGGVTHPGNPDAVPEVQSGSCGHMQIKGGGGPRTRPCAFAHPAWRGRAENGASERMILCPVLRTHWPACRRPRRHSVITSKTSITRSWPASLPSPRRNGRHPRTARRGHHRRPGAGQPGPSAAGRR